LEERYRISFRDALILQAAGSAGAGIVYSEYLSHGQQYASLLVRNPLLNLFWVPALLFLPFGGIALLEPSMNPTLLCLVVIFSTPVCVIEVLLRKGRVCACSMSEFSEPAA
jgi:hypothetical protein